MSRLLIAIALLAALLAGCGKNATEPPAQSGGGGLPPSLKATQPVARATRVPYDGEIWGEFDRPLDSRTVNTRSVFLKLDGQRISITVGYDGQARRVFIRPVAPLALQRTYTAEFSPTVTGTDGVPLPDGVFFQFTTNSLRRLSYQFPPEGSIEGPSSALGWGGDRIVGGDIFYDVYASPDSEAVVRRTAAVLQRSVFTRFLPTVAWPAGVRVFWAVTSEHPVTRERENGPLSAFQVLPADAVFDSVVVRAQDHGSSDIRSRNIQYCNTSFFNAGPSFNGCLHWNMSALPANIRIIGATVKLWTLDANANGFARTLPVLWMAQNDWTQCAVVAPGPPFVELSGRLADAVPVDGIEAHFDTPRLAAFFEALYRRRSDLFGTLIRTQENVSFHSLNTIDPNRVPLAVVRFVRLPPGVQD